MASRRREALAKARQYAEQSLEVGNRKWAVSCDFLGRACEGLGETDQAFDAWMQGLEIAKQNYPDHLWCVYDLQWAYRSLIDAYKRHNRLEEADAVAIDVTNFLDNLKVPLLANHPVHAYIRYERGVIQRLRGDLPGAKQSLTEAKERLAKFDHDLISAARMKEIEDELAEVTEAMAKSATNQPDAN